MIAGRALSDQDTWLIEFEEEFHELCDGQIDPLWLAGLACTLYPLNKDRAPREAAGVAFTTLGYELPQRALEDFFVLAPQSGRSALH
ncbi:hypothetical protein J2W25_006739 [Variovorax boronicumulans]|uniref:Uncharacterized protein n=1 Tax=Variovorax boronicumulans TaxID=436515 RepID=A0AAW8E7B6_9BURK|nr:hypothetical protein [Variovorax boronicumulans]MDP9882399.1 hypothetical protein [Variovorax boronicumulans]MDP9927685.1 hypothetical protein [Variovorax boronicumulans]